MYELQGKYNSAKVFATIVEQEALDQIATLLDQEFVQGSTIRIMPDVHAGYGCTIGTTMTITDKVVPNLVGVDIGCGMETVFLGNAEIDLSVLDNCIRENVPAGFHVHDQWHPAADTIDLAALCCANQISIDRAYKSIGTLGGGNHFIELDEDDEGSRYLVVHSGSRYLGKQIADYYQKAAIKQLSSYDNSAIVQKLIAEGRQREIEAEIRKQTRPTVPKDLAYVEGQLCDDYLHDMAVAQEYASLNRRAMTNAIINGMNLNPLDGFTTIHNYIDMDDRVLRKGAISAKAGERVLIPLNMRDGSLICKGRGNPDWNCSAPHGAGRLMSRGRARAILDVQQFKESMQGVYSSTVCAATIDESPLAYKPMEEILANIGDTVEILKTIKPVYNFKAAD